MTLSYTSASINPQKSIANPLKNCQTISYRTWMKHPTNSTFITSINTFRSLSKKKKYTKVKWHLPKENFIYFISISWFYPYSLSIFLYDGHTIATSTITMLSSQNKILFSKLISDDAPQSVAWCLFEQTNKKNWINEKFLFNVVARRFFCAYFYYQQTKRKVWECSGMLGVDDAYFWELFWNILCEVLDLIWWNNAGKVKIISFKDVLVRNY